MKKLVLVFGFFVSGFSSAQEFAPIGCEQTRAGCPYDCTKDPRGCFEKIPVGVAVDSEIAEYLYNKLPVVYDLSPNHPFKKGIIKGIALLDDKSGKYSILSCELEPLRILIYSCTITETYTPGDYPEVSSPSGILDLLKAKAQ